MTKPIPSLPKVALVGVSGYGRIHYDLIQKAVDLGLIELAAVVIINPEEEAAIIAHLKEQDIRVYRAFDHFLAIERGSLDLCFLPTAIHSHAPMTVAAMHAGMNVLVEKPLAGSIDQADWIIDAQKKTGKFVAVGFQDMYMEETRRLKARILEGAIGKLKSIRFMGLWPRPVSYYKRNYWTGKLVVDGVQTLDSPLNNAFAHFINLSLFLAGTEPNSTATTKLIDAELLRAHAIESFDTGIIRAQSPEGVQFWFGASHACDTLIEPILEIEGTEGQAMWYYDDCCEILKENVIAEKWPVPDAFVARWEMFKAVIYKLANSTVLLSTPISAREHAALIEAAYHSTEIKSVVPSHVDRVLVENGKKGDYIPAIRGLTEALKQAFDQGSTLSETVFKVDQAV